MESVDAQPPGNHTHTQGSENPWCDWFRRASCVNGKQKQQPLSFDEMFIDIGANSREEVEKRGVEIGNFISPEANFACWGEDKVVGKALDNRIGCAIDG